MTFINPYRYSQQVRYVGSGTPAAVGSGTTINVPYPAVMPIGGQLIMQLAIGSLTPQIAADPSGWATKDNDTDSSFIRQYLLHRYINGTESGNVTVTFGSAIGNVALAMIHVFENEKITLPFDEGGGLVIDDLTYSPASITTTVPYSLAVSFVYLPSIQTVGAYTGSTGGTWVSRATAQTTLGSDATIQLQTADMPAPGTISGGSYSAGGGGLTMNRSFAIKRV